MDLGNKLFTLRKNHNLTQEELAKMIGITEGAIRNYETARHKPKEKHLEKIARALNVRVEALNDYGAITDNQIIHSLFRLEDNFSGLQPIKIGNRVYLQFNNPEISAGIKEWSEHRKDFEEGKISKTQYEEWKNRYYLGTRVDYIDGKVVNVDTKLK